MNFILIDLGIAKHLMSASQVRLILCGNPGHLFRICWTQNLTYESIFCIGIVAYEAVTALTHLTEIT